MSKKNFKPQLNNPAMQFISQTANTDNTIEAAQIIQKVEATQLNKAQQNSYIKPESRDKRLQLLLQPSLYQAIKAKATQDGRSVNDLIHEVLNTFFGK